MTDELAIVQDTAKSRRRDRPTHMIMPIHRIHDNPPHRIELYFIAPLLQRVPQLHTRRRPVSAGHAVEGVVVDDGVAWC